MRISRKTRALTAALAGVVMLAVSDDESSAARQQDLFEQAFEFLVKPDAEVPEEPEGQA